LWNPIKFVLAYTFKKEENKRGLYKGLSVICSLMVTGVHSAKCLSETGSSNSSPSSSGSNSVQQSPVSVAKSPSFEDSASSLASTRMMNQQQAVGSTAASPVLPQSSSVDSDLSSESEVPSDEESWDMETDNEYDSWRVTSSSTPALTESATSRTRPNSMEKKASAESLPGNVFIVHYCYFSFSLR
jgi:hypothetical protein